MKKRFVIFFVLCLVLATSVVYSSAWINPLVNNINTLRDKYDLPPVKYDYDLHYELLRIKNNTWDGYFYEQMPAQCIKMPYDRCNYNRGYFLRPLGRFPGWHDTILMSNRILRIMKQRIAQERCFNISLCSRDEFTNWISCLKDPSEEANVLPGKCIWSYHYFPKLLLPMTKFACVILKYETGLSPISQPYSFWCYTDYDWINSKNDLLAMES